MKLKDDSLITINKKQNRIETISGEFYMRVVKRVCREKGNKSQFRKAGTKKGFIIIEANEETHEMMLRKGKLNIGWRKCPE